MKKFSIKYSDKEFADKNDFMKFLSTNKKEFVQLKKKDVKTHQNKIIESDNKKMYTPIKPKIEVTTDHIKVIAVINTTNLIDSHLDLHLPKIWDNNLRFHPEKIQLQEHKMVFENVLSYKAKAYTKNYTFNQLGFDSDIKTQALIHEFNFKQNDNPLMFKNYVEGNVTNHSVGMQYVGLSLAYNDPDDEKEYNYFQENKAKAANPEVAEEYGYFWVVGEAKDREGSAGVLGSNFVTPTLEVTDYVISQESARKQSQDTMQSSYNFYNQLI